MSRLLWLLLLLLLILLLPLLLFSFKPDFILPNRWHGTQEQAGHQPDSSAKPFGLCHRSIEPSYIRADAR